MASLTVGEYLASDSLDLKQELERILHEIFRHHVYPAGSEESFFAVVPPIETWSDTEATEFHVSMQPPDANPDAFNIILQGKNLIFSNEQEPEEEQKSKSYMNAIFPMIVLFEPLPRATARTEN